MSKNLYIDVVELDRTKKPRTKPKRIFDSSVKDAQTVTTDTPSTRKGRQDAVRDPFLIKIGNNLRRCRIARGLSQVQLAVKAEIGQTIITSIENAVGNPTLLSMRRIVIALDCKLSDIITDDL